MRSGFALGRKIPAFCLFVAVSVCGASEAQFRPSKEWRTINTDVYEISVQKNGRTDLKTTSGIALFENAFPAIQFAGEDEIEQLAISAVYSNRQEVKDRLGSGQGLALRLDECEWQLRAYPAKPYLAVQVIYHNDGKKPVQIEKLLPWCVGAPKKGSVWLGLEAAQTRLLVPGQPTEVLEVNATGAMHLTAFNPLSGRNLIAGFLSNQRARTEVHIARSEDAEADRFDYFRAACIYDPPITVPPGGKLESEVFYIAVGEQDPLFGLRRYGKAVAVWSGVRDARPFVPHGLHLSGEDLNEVTVLAAIESTPDDFIRAGWRHLTIGEGWAMLGGSGEADPARFPNGLRAIADAAHARGLTVGLEVNPFANASPAHDMTAPGAREHVVALARRIGSEWGFDAISEGGSASRMLDLGSLHAPDLTRTESYQLGLAALREGLGDNKILMAGGPPELGGVWADTVRIEGKNEQTAFTEAARSFYWTPTFFLAQPMLSMKNTNSPEQQLARLTAMAMLGGVVTLDTPYNTLDESIRKRLSRLLPVAVRPARPIDLFDKDAPAILHLHHEEAAGTWHVLGIFNTDATGDQVIAADLRSLGLDPEAYHTVYDFWAGHYHGVAQGRIEVRVPAGEHRLVGLRVYQDRPMVLASDAHIAMGALDLEAVQWNPASRTLSGSINTLKSGPRTLAVLVPEAFTPTDAEVDGTSTAWEANEKILRLKIPVSTKTWQIQFD